MEEEAKSSAEQMMGPYATEAILENQAGNLETDSIRQRLGAFKYAVKTNAQLIMADGYRTALLTLTNLPVEHMPIAFVLEIENFRKLAERLTQWHIITQCEKGQLGEGGEAEHMAMVGCHNFLIRALAWIIAHCFRDLHASREGAKNVAIRDSQGKLVESYLGIREDEWASPRAWEEVIKAAFVHVEDNSIEEEEQGTKIFKRHPALAAGLLGGLGKLKEGGKKNEQRPKKDTFLDYSKLEVQMPAPVAASLIHFCTANYVEKENFAWRLATRYSMGGSEKTGRRSTNKTVNILEFPVALTMEGSELLTIAGAAKWLEKMEKVRMREASIDLRRMRGNINLMQGLILPRKVIIKGCIQMSTLQEYACRDVKAYVSGRNSGREKADRYSTIR